jgi:hypothetical protein
MVTRGSPPVRRTRSSLEGGTCVMARARLSENQSTAPTFREGDLLVANLLPMGAAVHQVSFVVRASVCVQRLLQSNSSCANAGMLPWVKWAAGYRES